MQFKVFLFCYLGGLDDALNMIINLCSEQDVPFVFALGRRSLGRACAKLVPVSVVGIFNYQGAEVCITTITGDIFFESLLG